MSDQRSKDGIVRACRVCLAPEANRIFNNFFDRRHDFAEKLFFVSQIKVFEISSNAPALICYQCEEDLNTAARVKRSSLVAERFFKNMIKSEEIKIFTDNGINFSELPHDEIITEFKQELDPHEIQENEEEFFNAQEFNESDPDWNYEGDTRKETKQEEEEDESENDDDDDEDELFNLDTSRSSNKSERKRRKRSERKQRERKERTEKRSYQKGGTKEGICNICGINLTTKERLMNHIRVRHDIVNENEMIPCPVEGCRKRFKIQLYVERHVQNIHNRDRTQIKEKEFWPCSICGIILGSKTALKQHEYRHTVPAQEKKLHSYFCDLCPFSSDKKIRVKYHIERIHLQLRKFKCKFCDQAFVHSSLLQYHELRIHLNLRKFACRYCDKSFTRSSCRLIHERIHTNERPYSCRFCERTFIHHSDYRRHELRHTGGIPIKQFQEQMKQGLVQYVN